MYFIDAYFIIPNTFADQTGHLENDAGVVSSLAALLTHRFWLTWHLTYLRGHEMLPHPKGVNVPRITGFGQSLNMLVYRPPQGRSE